VPETGPSKEVRGALPVGTRLQSYGIISVLGQGGFGITYLAHDTTLDCRVAVKEYLPALLAFREADGRVVPRSTELAEPFIWGRERFLSEARTLAKLGHAPAIARVHDLIEDNGTAYMVMELAEGETLHRRLLRDNSLSPPVVDRLFSSLLEGLEAVHVAGLLHNDIKPSNILVDARGNPTLIDFGAARAAMAGRTAALAATFTLGYAAAEQFTAAKKGPWTDIHGLSATLYHAITGAPPPSAFDRLLEDGYQPLAKLMPSGFAPGLLVGIDAGLNVRPSDRPQSIADWRAILPPSGPLDESATFVMRGPSTATAIARSSIGGKRGVTLWVGLAAALIAAAVVADGALRFTAPPGETADGASVSDDAAARKAAAKKAEREAASRREAEAEKARREQQKAAMESARLAAEAEARSAQATQNAAVQDAVRRDTAAEETRRRTDAAATADKAADAKPKTAADARQQAEKAEAALNLSDADHKRVQAALTALGHAVPATGHFGSITRSMITAWQKTQGLPETGFLDATQLAKLAAPAAAENKAEPSKLAAQRAEAALNLSDKDRKRIQVALTSLGHEIPTTGYFGPITRSMITAWQKAQGLPATGYLSDTQLATLKQQAAAALAKYDQAQAKSKEPRSSQ